MWKPSFSKEHAGLRDSPETWCVSFVKIANMQLFHNLGNVCIFSVIENVRRWST